MPFALALLVVAGCGGKGTEGTCAAGAICGGTPPAGIWDVAGLCAYSPTTPQQPLGPREQVQVPLFPVLTALQPEQTTNGDWCSSLYYSPQPKNPQDPNSSVTDVTLWHAAPPLAPGGQITLNADANGQPTTYSVSLNFEALNQLTHFSPACLEYYGATPTCAQLGPNLQDFYNSTAGVDTNNAPLPASFQGIGCQNAADGGCDCFYDYKVHLTDSGSWSSGGNFITEASDLGSYQFNGKPVGSQGPNGLMVASTCLDGNALTLTGFNGANLSNAPGLRVLTLLRHM